MVECEILDVKFTRTLGITKRATFIVVILFNIQYSESIISDQLAGIWICITLEYGFMSLYKRVYPVHEAPDFWDSGNTSTTLTCPLM